MRLRIQTVFVIAESWRHRRICSQGTNLSKNPRMFSKSRRCEKPIFPLYFHVLASNNAFKKGELDERTQLSQSKYLLCAAADSLFVSDGFMVYDPGD